MKALSIRQPWAWLILHAGKDIENRTWQTKVRGRMLIHAAKGMTTREFHAAQDFVVKKVGSDLARRMNRVSDMYSGGIVGSVEIVDCVTSSSSPWWMGPVGFVLRDPRPMPLMPYKGRLGFFDVPEISP